MIDPRTIWAFVRLARLHFLAGGFLLYGLGAAMARYEGHAIDWVVYAIGQWFVTSAQLMTQFANEYWDVEADRANRNRTLFSGGSGVLASGQLNRDVAWRASIVCLCSALAAALTLIVAFHAGPASWLVMLVALGGAWFYSAPPLALSASGLGELAASLIVACLLPAYSHLLQTGALTPLVLSASAPLVALHFGMVLAFAMPDAAADEATGKRTLAVRLGRRRAAWAHHAAMVVGVALFVGMSRLAGVPTASLPVILLATTQIWQMARLARLARGPFGWLTLNAVSSFFIAAALTTVDIWRSG